MIEVADPPQARAKYELPMLVAGALLVLAWPFVLSTFGHDDVYAFMGPYGVLVIGLMLLLRRFEAPLRPARAPSTAASLAIGLAVGAIMTAGTYLAFAVGTMLYPPLAARVGGLYADAHTRSLGSALAWTLVLIVAEELLWRGALLGVLQRRYGRTLAIGLSLATYTLAQAGTGSFIVGLAALVCGAIWTAERMYTASSLAPLVSHSIWTVTVIHLLPVVDVASPK